MSTRPPLTRLSVPRHLIDVSAPGAAGHDAALVSQVPSAITHEGPDPALGQIAARFARLVTEAITGRRAPAQLVPVLGARSAAVLHGLGAVSRDARVRGVRWQSPRPGVIESAIQLGSRNGLWAVAVRLEYHQARWRAVALEVAPPGERHPRR